MTNYFRLEKEAGYSMTEILVVLVIVGILVLLALPRFTSVVARAKMTEAKVALRQVQALQEVYFYEHDTYAADLDALGFEAPRPITEGGTARYIISVEESGPTHFTATATALVDFDRDGILNVWAVDADGPVAQRVAD